MKVKKLRLTLILSGMATLAFLSVVFGMLMAVASELPALEDQEQYKVARPSEMLDHTGRRLAVLRNNEKRILVQPNQIAPSMKHAVVALEDRRFYRHKGVDYRGIGRALYQDVRQRAAKQGGSTITQQFVKNALLANNNRTVLQKLRESALAYHLERQWSKEKILGHYLNTVYFGNGAYGVEAAARTYFGRQHPGCEQPGEGCATALRPWESALLAAIIASPSGFDPLVFPRAASARRDTALKAMLDQGYITRSLYAEGLRVAVPAESDVNRPTEDSVSPYFSTWVRQQLVDRYDAGVTFGGGLKVRTTLDLDLQKAAEQAVQGRLPAGGPSASLVVIENSTGKVRAMVGGADYETKPFNLATQGHRQPGSSFKTFVLIGALQKGFGLGSKWSSRKKTFFIKGVGKFEVNNYEDAYSGSNSLIGATMSSDNSIFAEVGLKVGTRRVARLANRMGIETAISTNPAMILGGLKVGVTPLEMAYAYSTLANGGRRAVGTLAGEGGVSAIEEVRQGGKVFRESRNRTKYRRVIKPGTARLATSALQAVVARGTAKKAAIGSFAAGKTGTTENYGDAWFVGYTEKYSVAVWVGYPDELRYMETEYGGKPVAGGTFPAEIWHDFMLAAKRVQLLRSAERKAGATEAVPTPVPGATSGSGAPDAPAPAAGSDPKKRKPSTDPPPKNNRPPKRPETAPGPADPVESVPPVEPDAGGGAGSGGL